MCALEAIVVPSIFKLIRQAAALTRMFVYHESIKRDLKRRPISECRCDERLKTKAEESTCLAYMICKEIELRKIDFFAFLQKKIKLFSGGTRSYNDAVPDRVWSG